ncbi:MAG: ABC transporter substrate-binding protein [Actinobacteria bacterium]|nr:ABC transporter substrate-binding protein [Actinomycetota bacterium]
MSEDKKLNSNLDQGGVTRRKILQGAGAGALMFGGGSLLAACGGGSSTTSGGGATTGGGGGGEAEGKPVAGGVLRVGAQGGSNTDSLDAHNVLTNADYARAAQLYDALIRIDNKGQPQLVLAESLEPNKDATEWTVKLKKGVKFHDGSTMEAKDVLYSFNRIVKGKYPGLYALGPINMKACKAVDPLTVKLVFSTPYSLLEEALTLHWYLYIVPTGYNPKQPIGCGPFKLKSFTPGRESSTVKFDEYWDAPKPYLDEVKTINIAEETAQVNALQAGQVDAVDYLTAASIATLESSGQKVVISKSGGWVPFTMRVDKAPYSDNNLREGLRWLVDREQMNQSVFSGNGTIGNDIFGIYDKFYDKSLFPQREQDLEKAESLIKKGNAEGQTLQLISTPNAPGMTQMPQVLKTQAEAANVKINVTIQPTTEYFARSYLKVPFSMDYWPYAPYLVDVAQATLPGAPFSATYFNNPAYTKLYEEASATLDEGKKGEIVHEMMKMDYDEGGYIIPIFFPVIDGVAPYVYGVEPSVTGQALSTFQFQNFWIKK